MFIDRLLSVEADQIVVVRQMPGETNQDYLIGSMSRKIEKQSAEKEITQAIIRFEKEFMGRGPLNGRTYLIEDMVLVRLKNVLTPAEHKLAEAQVKERGRNLIKQMRQELIEQGRPLLDAVIKDILGLEVVSLHTDISAKTGERIIVFTLEEAPRFA